MVFNTATVGSAVTPAVIQTFVTHYLNHGLLAQKPTAHISYDEGLHLIRQFLIYASHHTVEDIQRFTSQWVPHPRWVKVDEVKISQECITKAAEAIQEQLGHHGIEKVGGKTWWQWRRPGSELMAEWIEMRSDYHERKRTKEEGKRVMLYVHGGAYFFGSVDEHRYQMQRHARKLKAKVFAPRYRLAPQFPFPCGLHDCLSAYLYLLNVQDPSTIILAGDSAGGGMVLSILVTMRDRGIPLPAGAVLISPWVDLTHSFPSVASDNPLDYIPSHGFHHRPSPSWPPPNSDEMLAMTEDIVRKLVLKDHITHQNEEDTVQGLHVDHHPNANAENDIGTNTNDHTGPNANTVTGPGDNLSIMLDGNWVEIKDQIQMYASNRLISHPLVSPILQPSLGGLPPLLILTGGGEMLRDEQIYLAHKAANPAKYPPGDAFLDESPHNHGRDQINRWNPTDVQLQVWDDLCHVAPTLSFTRPAKHMYRSIAQFSAWALARAQKTEIEILDDDDVSIISKSSTEFEDDDIVAKQKKNDSLKKEESKGQVGKAGDPLPPFRDHMIRQRVNRHGHIYPLEQASELPACNIPPSEIGVIKEGPVRKWMAAKKAWDTKYASAKRKVQTQRSNDMAKGYSDFGDGEVPPPSALAGRRKTGADVEERSKKRSMGMSLWSLWGSKHDEKAMVREKEAGREPEVTVASAADGAGARGLYDTKTTKGKKMMDSNKQPESSRSMSRRRTVSDQHQTENLQNDGDVGENTQTAKLLAIKQARLGEMAPGDSHLTPDLVAGDSTPVIDKSELKRPKLGGIAFPFSLKTEGASASMTTLTSVLGVPPTEDLWSSGVKESWVGQNTADVEVSNSKIGQNKAPEILIEDKKFIEDISAAASGKENEESVSNGVNGNSVENIEVANASQSP